MHILWGIIQNYLLLPAPLRIFVILGLITFLLLLTWKLTKYIPVFIIVLLSVLNKLVTMVSRRLICTIGRKSPHVYTWDEKIGKSGRTRDDRLNRGIAWLQKSTWRQILNAKFLLILGLIYILAILPNLPLQNIIDEYYIEHMYGVNSIFTRFEKMLEEKAEGYPPIIDCSKWNNKPSNDVVPSVKPMTETDAYPVYLQLNQSTYYAYVRESPEKAGAEVCIVGRDDTLIYQNEYVSEKDRYWLKVLVESNNNLEGWISSKVIESSILDELNLD